MDYILGFQKTKMIPKMLENLDKGHLFEKLSEMLGPQSAVESNIEPNAKEALAMLSSSLKDPDMNPSNAFDANSSLIWDAFDVHEAVYSGIKDAVYYLDTATPYERDQLLANYLEMSRNDLKNRNYQSQDKLSSMMRTHAYAWVLSHFQTSIPNLSDILKNLLIETVHIHGGATPNMESLDKNLYLLEYTTDQDVEIEDIDIEKYWLLPALLWTGGADIIAREQMDNFCEYFITFVNISVDILSSPSSPR